MRKYNPVVLGLAALALILLVAVLVLARGRLGSDPEPVGNSATTSRGQPAAGRCGSQATFDRIKVELFRQAAQLRSSDQAAFDRLAAYSSVRMDRPLLREADEELGTIRCTGRLSLDLPPGVAVVGGRRTLSADIDYVLQPAADNSGDVVMLEGEDPITVPLATLARTGETAAPPAVPDIDQQLPDADTAVAVPPGAPVSEPPPSADTGPSEPPATTTARPSFNCRYARTRGEIAVCNDSGLAALDRQMSREYYRALSLADARQRRLLATSRDTFLRYRDRCSNNACIAASYRDRMREISDIVRGEWRPNR